MKQVAVILLLVAAFVATIYNYERNASPVAASFPEVDRQLELVEEEPAVITPSLRSSVVVEASVPVVEGTTVAEPAVVEEPVVVEAPAVVETQVEPAVEEQVVESAVAEAIKVTTEAAPLDPVQQEEEATDEGEVSVLLGQLE